MLLIWLSSLYGWACIMEAVSVVVLREAAADASLTTSTSALRSGRVLVSISGFSDSTLSPGFEDGKDPVILSARSLFG